MLTRAIFLMLPLIAVAAQAAEAPEATIRLDTQWLSPPQVAPQGGQAMAQQTEDATRFQGAPGAAGSSFTWPLRYAIEAQRYPILTLRYLARDLMAGMAYGNRVMDVQLVDSGGRVTALTAINLEDLIQDGAVHEIRKDLSQVPPDAFIDQIRFNFHGGTSGGRLDVYDIIFDRGPNSPAPYTFQQQQVGFIVRDAAGNAVPDADVRLGLLERGNWIALGTTDGAGQLTLTTITLPRPDGTVEPVEAVVLKQGYLPQYVAPVTFPRTGPLEVKLSPVAQQAADVPQPIAQEPEQLIYSTPAYDTTPYAPYPVYSTYSYVQPWAPYWWVPPRYIRHRPLHWRDHDDRWTHFHRDPAFVRKYDHPRPVVVDPSHRIDVPPRPISPPRVHHGPVMPGDNSRRWINRPGSIEVSDPAGQVNVLPPQVAPPPSQRDVPPPNARGGDDQRQRGQQGEPGRGVEPPRKVVSPPSERLAPSDPPRTVAPPRKVEPAPAPGREAAPEKTRNVAPEKAGRTESTPVVIRVPERSDPPKLRDREVAEVTRPERRDPPARIVAPEPPARVQRDSDDTQRPQPRPERRDPPVQVKRENPDDQRPQVRPEPPPRQEVRREQPQRQEAQREEARRTEARRDESRGDEMRREIARRDEPRPSEVRPVREAPPPPAARGDNVGRSSPQQDPDGDDGQSAKAGPARGSKR